MKPLSKRDTRLLKAAPDMLAALKWAVKLADDNLAKGYSSRTDECSRCYAACLVAIAKTKPAPRR